jgi:hypothetical protein
MIDFCRPEEMWDSLLEYNIITLYLDQQMQSNYDRICY